MSRHFQGSPLPCRDDFARPIASAPGFSGQQSPPKWTARSSWVASSEHAVTIYCAHCEAEFVKVRAHHHRGTVTCWTEHDRDLGKPVDYGLKTAGLEVLNHGGSQPVLVTGRRSHSRQLSAHPKQTVARTLKARLHEFRSLLHDFAFFSVGLWAGCVNLTADRNLKPCQDRRTRGVGRARSRTSCILVSRSDALFELCYAALCSPEAWARRPRSAWNRCSL